MTPSTPSPPLPPQIAGRNPPKPCRTFEEGSFPDYILAVVEKEYGVKAAPTPVQAQAWPVALSGRDCINVAETGTTCRLPAALPPANPLHPV